MTDPIVTTDLDAVVSEIEIAAPPERVFQAITDPRQLLQWWGSPGKYRLSRWEADVRPGGKWRSEGKSVTGETFEVGGEYLQVDPPRLLVYTWVSSWDGGLRTQVHWELTPVPEGTLVRVRHSGFAGQFDKAQKYAGGWPGVLAWVRGYLEHNETVDMRK
jgi:uncharacterized protein YndB with AHSA1/START domain